MMFDFAALDGPSRYKLITAAVTPRPIAWITSQDGDGLVNAAPFSFFNAFSATPPILGIGIGDRDDVPAGATPKDTKANIRTLGEFVVNLVDEASADAMNHTAIAFPKSVGEASETELETIRSEHVRPPRIARSPVSFECLLHQEVPLGPANALILGRIVAMHVNDAFILDAERQHLATDQMKLIGRMHGGGYYSRTTDLFRLDRIALKDWKSRALP